ncbi:MAG: 50S ribosomal protein L31 [Anaerolineae bacterium]|jgi:large subunit ribosomal protein L31
MKEGIHPKYFPEAQVICACGNTWTTGATQEVIRTDVCSACHPFFTGEQRIVDTAGQVERFMRRLEKKVEITGQEEEG